MRPLLWLVFTLSLDAAAETVLMPGRPILPVPTPLSASPEPFLPIPRPTPSPLPTPSPILVPRPTPSPVPTPTPVIIPRPTPSPVPSPTPMPTPRPVEEFWSASVDENYFTSSTVTFRTRTGIQGNLTGTNPPFSLPVPVGFDPSIPSTWGVDFGISKKASFAGRTFSCSPTVNFGPNDVSFNADGTLGPITVGGNVSPQGSNMQVRTDGPGFASFGANWDVNAQTVGLNMYGSAEYFTPGSAQANPIQLQGRLGSIFGGGQAPAPSSSIDVVYKIITRGDGSFSACGSAQTNFNRDHAASINIIIRRPR